MRLLNVKHSKYEFSQNHEKSQFFGSNLVLTISETQVSTDQHKYKHIYQRR